MIENSKLMLALDQSRPKAGIIVFMIASLVLVIASFATLGLQITALFTPSNWQQGWTFVVDFVPPNLSERLLHKIATAAFETLAMSLLGTLIAALLGLLLSAFAAQNKRPLMRAGVRFLLNVLRSIPDLVWAGILLIAAGLGPFPGTLALAAHTTGALGRLFADAIENLPPEPSRALQQNGASAGAVFLYATLPQLLPQMASYTLYRWENNIRAAAVLGVVGAGGLGQMLYFHLSLFQMHQAASVILAMITLVILVDAASYSMRHHLTR